MRYNTIDDDNIDFKNVTASCNKVTYCLASYTNNTSDKIRYSYFSRTKDCQNEI